MIFKGEFGKIKINILKRSVSNSDDYWDANWLESEIKIEIPDFTAHYKTNLRVNDLQVFYDALINLENLSAKKAEFKTLEEGLYLECIANKRGTILCQGKATNQYNNSLHFEISTDVGSLSSWISELRFALNTYPLIGKKSKISH